MSLTPRKIYSVSSSPASERAMENGLDGYDLIDLINELQNTLGAGDHVWNLVSLPQIVVVGNQSAGKSSVLESLVGEEFLPRGSDTVTRRPTVIRLQPCEGEKYAIFGHKEEKFTEFENVKNEIVAETLRDPGPSGFSSTPIILTIYAPDVLKLSLVDLPGMVKNRVGDESENCDEVVRDLVLDFIQKPNTLILAVSPANQEIANCDALKIANKVDPGRERTIGVVTKLDLMDEGTNACEILENKKLPLKRGYVGVLNRSQKDIDEGRDIEYCLQKEKKFFETKDCYKHLADKMGTPYLKKVLQDQLREHIKDYLPIVRKELNEKLCSVRKNLKHLDSVLGTELRGDNCSGQSYMIKLIQQFVENFNIEMCGQSEKVRFDKLSIGSVINYKLYTELQQCIPLPPVPPPEELMIIISNLHGFRNILNVPFPSLETVCRHLIALYKDPINAFVDQIANMIVSHVRTAAEKLALYRSLQYQLLCLITTSINRAAQETKDSLDNHLESEMFFVNIYHADFKSVSLQEPSGGPIKIWSRDETKAQSTSENSITTFQSGKSNDDENNEIKKLLFENPNAMKNSEFLANAVQEYMLIVRKQTGDTAVKYIAYFLVKKVLDFLKVELIPSLLESKNLKSLVSDCERDFLLREERIRACKALEAALNMTHFF